MRTRAPQSPFQPPPTAPPPPPPPGLARFPPSHLPLARSRNQDKVGTSPLPGGADFPTPYPSISASWGGTVILGGPRPAACPGGCGGVCGRGPHLLREACRRVLSHPMAPPTRLPQDPDLWAWTGPRSTGSQEVRDRCVRV